MNINDVCDYIITKLTEGGEDLNLLKLQKLLYYVQAWHLAFKDTPLFENKFQAWVHGPVNREIYDRFNNEKTLYSQITQEDVRTDFVLESIDTDNQLVIDNVLEIYAPYSGTQLEEMTHNEKPWISARDGYRSSQRCEVTLDESLIGDYYRARLT